MEINETTPQEPTKVIIPAEQQIEALIDNLGQNFNVLKYAYNSKKFVPGETPVYYSGPYWDKQELMAGVKTLLLGEWLSAGEEVKKFEKMFGELFNLKYNVTVNSGSSANLLMMAALKKCLKWKDDDEIILSVVGFPTTLSSIILNNLKPVFIDIEFDTLNFDLNLIEEKITNKTKAIFLSPVLGNTCDMDRLVEICKRRGLEMVLDNCDSAGSFYKDKYLTDYAIASSCSFYPSHHSTIGQGGMISSNAYKIVNTARSMATWGRECHPIGTTVFTDKGVKNIEDIKVGEKVYTHLGNYKNVYELIRRKYDGDLYTFQSRRNENVTSTANHPFFVKRNNELMWILGKDLKKGDYFVQKVPNEIETPKTINFKYNTPTSKKEFNLNMESDLFRLSGYWLAEGSLAKGNKGSNGKNKPTAKGKYLFYRVDFAFHEDEVEYIKDVCFLMKKYFGVTGHTRKKKDGGKGIVLLFKTRKGYEFFLNTFKTKSYNKELPSEFIHYDKKLLSELIKGLWRGDGTNDFQSFSTATTSKKLAHQLRLILSRFGISPNLYIRTPEMHKSAIVNGKLIEAKHDLYNITCYGDNMRTFGKIVNEEFLDKKKNKITEYFTEDGKYALHEIQEIKIEKVKDLDVYNFEVEDDQSYHANGIASHNCHCSGAENLCANGSCGKRFSNWIKEIDTVIDHKYLFVNMGYNLTPLDLQGSFGQVQLEKFPEIHKKRIISKTEIQKVFEKHLPQVRIVNEVEHAKTSWFGTPIICESKDFKRKLVSFLEKNKIQTRNYFAGNILLHPAYKHLDDWTKYPIANKVLDEVFFVGAAPHYDQQVFDYFETVLIKFKEEYGY